MCICLLMCMDVCLYIYIYVSVYVCARLGSKVHWLKSSYDDEISIVDDFFTNEIQAPQRR